jgi:hypothetical protein
LALENLSLGDKIWVSLRVMTREQLVKFAAKCAESVYWLYVENYKDKDPLFAIESAKVSLRFPDKVDLDAVMNSAAARRRVAVDENNMAAAGAAQAAFAAAAAARARLNSVMFNGTIIGYANEAAYTSMSTIDYARLERGHVGQDQLQLVLNYMRDIFLGG